MKRKRPLRGKFAAEKMYRDLGRAIYQRYQRAATSRRKWLQKWGLLARLPDGATRCADCGRPAINYDHRDYMKPSAMTPVCGRCNSLRGLAPLNIGRLLDMLSIHNVTPSGYDPARGEDAITNETVPPLRPQMGDPGRGPEEVSQLQERAADDEAAETTGLT